MSTGVLWWWGVLCAVGAANVVAWGLSLVALWRRQTFLSAESYIACRRQVVLSAIYVFGCAFRSVLPVFDVPRLVLFNTWLSSVVVGRSVATVAELCFVAQWALMLRETARVTHSPVMKAISHLIVPLIVVAEICSWYSVLTTANIGHVIEESIWGTSAAMVAFTLTAFYPRCPAGWRPMLMTAVVAGTAYATYMFFVDVPMYWSRWIEDQASGRQYLSIAQGLHDTFQHRVVSGRWEDWKGEMVWMSLYFSVAVWFSISLAYAAMRKFAVRKPVIR